MTITSTAFQNNGQIPGKYTCDGKNVNPPLTFSAVLEETQSLVLIVSDPDALSSKPFVHWLLYNIPSAILQILEDEVPPNSALGTTDFGKTGYGGPCPPSGTHRYFFELFAVDMILDIPEGVNREEVEKAMEGHVLESSELMGIYKKGGDM
ncbi:MAG: YbhB/YbcL family Raf kinase inhibitor-like protein [Candidatus Levybacteria bacterium]|nr:YbhB/YbcL family Raf kinase inhibitor-like protein [Candidatus Levybacteria bacterium]